MKTLEDYNLIRDFVNNQGIEPTMAMLCAKDSEWNDLLYLAKSWKRELDEAEAERQAKLEGLSDEELGMLDKEHEEAQHKEYLNTLYHSSGHEPE